MDAAGLLELALRARAGAGLISLSGAASGVKNRTASQCVHASGCASTTALSSVCGRRSGRRWKAVDGGAAAGAVWYSIAHS